MDIIEPAIVRALTRLAHCQISSSHCAAYWRSPTHRP